MKRGGSRAARRRHPDRAAPLAAALLRTWRRSVPREEWRELDADALTRAAREQLEFGRVRRPGQQLLRVTDHGTVIGTVIELITDDMPFLVDTITLQLAQRGLHVRLIIHPVISVRRTADGVLRALGDDVTGRSRAESWQHLHTDRLTEEEGATLRLALNHALQDLRLAWRDDGAMRQRVLALCGEIERAPPPLARGVLNESVALLRYMAAGQFTFVGYRESRIRRAGSRLRLVPQAGTALGILRRGGEHEGQTASGPVPQNIRHALRIPELLVITKSNRRATLHRAGYLDYIGIKRFDARGRIVGEARILGLWTATLYRAAPDSVPWLRHKVAAVIRAFPFTPDSHDGKRLAAIIDALPRDELLQATVADLIRTVRAVLVLQNRPRTRLVLRRDEYRRFWSVLLFLPRERFDQGVRRIIEQLALTSLRGTQLDSSVALGDGPLAQLHLVVRVPPEATLAVPPAELERQFAAAIVSWRDRVREELIVRFGAERAVLLEHRYAGVLPADYAQEPPNLIAEDVGTLDELLARPMPAASPPPAGSDMTLRCYRGRGQTRQRMQLRVVKLGDALAISDVLPTLENLGLRVIAERPFLLRTQPRHAWVQDFELESHTASFDPERQGPRLIEAFCAVRAGEIDDDGFNRLVLAASLPARDVAVLRACGRYLLQIGLPFSLPYMAGVLTEHASVARALWELFAQRLQPATAGTRRDTLESRLHRGIDAVRSPDHDRILRAFLAVVQATLRTNHFRGDGDRPATALALKLDPGSIPGLPQPRPAFEIFVHSPRVEGVHLRKGAIARGGIRWSERPEDFRTEILGLMKAQHVKNTLIVPVGAKGGFVARQRGLPAVARSSEVVAAYRLFIASLLDVTDNVVGARVIPPTQVRRRDGDDPYLVVAADKGTATFSDTANDIASRYQFWLGDAFASGGSEGYDHKKMGITARGAWECVKRHFRELGRDIQRHDFTVAGIGDMSGDVFGNGMLQSRRIRLVAAFDHRHIFLDPNPDTAVSYRERARLFRLPRSSWADIDVRTLSPGGGVHARDSKRLTLPPEAQRLLGLPQREATPVDVIRAILCLPVDLLWNGGIGTYVKAADERPADIGDRANDAVRVDGRQLRARVIGEGGNLGCSQRGRVEYALTGGRLNADFIDNSAGVNTSDIEVNLKILLDAHDRREPVTPAARNRLLAGATSDVAALVLRNNYLQSQAISLMESRAPAELAQHAELLRWLERHGELDRAVEFLPDDAAIVERRRAGLGLTRPELALLLAYGKIALNHALLQSRVAEDRYLSRDLQLYFPPALRRRFPHRIEHHRLRRQIICTAITNSLVHRVGPGFVMQMTESTGADAGAIARAYTIVRDAGGMRSLWSALESLDGTVSAAAQYMAMNATSRWLTALTHSLLLRRHRYRDASATVRKLTPLFARLLEVLPEALNGLEREQFAQLRQQYLAAGIPAALAEKVACLAPLRMALDLAELARYSASRCRRVATLHFQTAAHLGIDWLYQAIEQLPSGDAWQQAARARLLGSVLRDHRRLTTLSLRRTRKSLTSPARQHWDSTLRDLRRLATPDLAALSVAVEALAALAALAPGLDGGEML
jgi:glutamate dehydrogenase